MTKLSNFEINIFIHEPLKTSPRVSGYPSAVDEYLLMAVFADSNMTALKAVFGCIVVCSQKLPRIIFGPSGLRVCFS